MKYRYWLRVAAGPERETDLAGYIAAERAAGFGNVYGREDQPAHAAWSAKDVTGRIEYVHGRRPAAAAKGRHRRPARTGRKPLPDAHAA